MVNIWSHKNKIVSKICFFIIFLALNEKYKGEKIDVTILYIYNIIPNFQS